MLADEELKLFNLGWPEHFCVMWRSELLNENSPRLQQARLGCCVHGYASLRVEGDRRSRFLDEAKRMLRLLRPSLV